MYVGNYIDSDRVEKCYSVLQDLLELNSKAVKDRVEEREKEKEGNGKRVCEREKLEESEGERERERKI